MKLQNQFVSDLKDTIKKYSENEINGSVYDPDSIMLYFYPPQLTLNNQGTKENLRLSETDKEWIVSTYNSNNKFTKNKEETKAIKKEISNEVQPEPKITKKEPSFFYKYRYYILGLGTVLTIVLLLSLSLKQT